VSTILIVDDEEAFVGILSRYLTSEKYKVVTALTGSEARELMLMSSFDLIILDWRLPDISGLDLCKLFRSQGGETPIIFVTGKNDIVDKEQGLDAGGDDYLTKPFEVRELKARIRALLRRPAHLQEVVLQVKDVVLDLTARKVSKRGEEVKLFKKEFELLEFFMRHPDVVLNTDKILQTVWAGQFDASPEALRQCVARLRSVLDDPRDGTTGKKKSSLIRTIYGVGYRLETS
jgi:DNA-binding response OmpR family regulator